MDNLRLQAITDILNKQGYAGKFKVLSIGPDSTCCSEFNVKFLLNGEHWEGATWEDDGDIKFEW